jgi:hypothetical protein
MKLVMMIIVVSFCSTCFAKASISKPCGLTGSIEARIKNCLPYSNPPGSGGADDGDFILVTRTGEGFEVYLDPKTSTNFGPDANTLWTAALPELMNQVEAEEACDNPEYLEKLTVYLACHGLCQRCLIFKLCVVIITY